MNIQTDTIQVSFGSKTILHDISLAIQDKEFVGIIGPNGSGKSTFLKCLYRVLQPSGGKIYFDGSELSSLSHRDTSLKMAVVAQHSTVNFDFSVLEMVLMGRSPYKGLLDRDKIDDYEIARYALEQVGLSDFANRTFNTLSGGEQQMVGIVRAMIGQPKILLMDEPFSALDAISRKQLQVLTKELHKEFGMTTIFVTHDTDEALKLADRIAVLQDGEIRQVANPETILKAPATEFVADLFGGSVHD